MGSQMSLERTVMAMFDNYPDVVAVKELCHMWQIGKNTAYYLLKNHKIKSIKIGKVHKIPKIYVIKYLRSKN